jgi:Myb-like DNA-binding protein FlbD
MVTLRHRGPWGPDEDQLLLQAIDKHGTGDWVRISQDVQYRSPKQCRERFHQSLNPSLNTEPISEYEGLLIKEMVNQIGKRWAFIARQLGGRSDNAVKNWWNSSMNRKRRNQSMAFISPIYMHSPQSDDAQVSAMGQPRLRSSVAFRPSWLNFEGIRTSERCSDSCGRFMARGSRQFSRSNLPSINQLIGDEMTSPISFDVSYTISTGRPCLDSDRSFSISSCSKSLPSSQLFQPPVDQRPQYKDRDSYESPVYKLNDSPASRATQYSASLLEPTQERWRVQDHQCFALCRQCLGLHSTSQFTRSMSLCGNPMDLEVMLN